MFLQSSRECRLFVTRRIMSGATALGIMLVIFASAGLAQYTGPAPTKSDSPNPPANPSLTLRAPSTLLPGMPITLHNGDLIDVSVYGVPDYKVKARIAGNGQADLPLIGFVDLNGLTIEQAQQAIADKLKAGGMILAPDVTIAVEDSLVDAVNVTGEVGAPRLVPAFAPMNLIDVLTAAGGLKPTASHSISILRKGVPQPLLVVVNSNPAEAARQNVPIYPGDTVIVPRTGVVYVVGAVRSQRDFPLPPNTPLTLMQAVSLAGGANYEAQKSDTRIIRTIGATRQEIPVDLAKVMKGTASDPILQNDDIILIPTNEMKAAIRGGGLGFIIGLLYLLPRP